MVRRLGPLEQLAGRIGEISLVGSKPGRAAL